MSSSNQGEPLASRGELSGDGLAAVRKLITREELQSLTRPHPWQVVLRLIGTWAAILIAMEVGILASSPFLDVAAFVVIGCAQNALILWTHEASHYGLSRSRRGWNDVLADLLVSGPAGISVAGYRWQHLRHHRALGDPEQEVDLMAWSCVRGTELAKQILRHMAGLYALGVVLRYRQRSGDERYGDLPPRSPASVIGFLSVNGALFAACALQGQWHHYFLLWVAPLFTLALAIGNLRTIAEHQPNARVCEDGLTRIRPVVRSVRYGWLGRLCIAPLGFSYHVAHHAFPGVPHHRLRELHSLLSERGCFQRDDVVVGDGYLRTLWRLSTDPTFGAELTPPVGVGPSAPSAARGT